MKRTSYSAVLLSVFCSPGTFATVTLTVTAAPTGGALPSVSDASAVWPRAIVSTVREALIGLSPPSTVTVTLTSNSSFSPWLVNLTTIGVSAPAVTRLGASGCSVVSPIATLSIPVPCRPGAGVLLLPLPAAAAELLAQLCRHRLLAQPLDPGQEARGRDLLAADLGVVERVLDERRGARLVEDVGGQEHLHLRRRSP